MHPQTAIWKVPAYAFAVFLVVAIAWITLPAVLPWQVRYLGDIRAGNAIIANIEQFRREHGRLPDRDNTDEVNALGFTFPIDYFPDYRAFGDEYQIDYMEGFEGPYIVYSSK